MQLLCIERPSSLPEFIKLANLIILSRSTEKIQNVSAPDKYHQPFGGNRPALLALPSTRVWFSCPKSVIKVLPKISHLSSFPECAMHLKDSCSGESIGKMGREEQPPSTVTVLFLQNMRNWNCPCKTQLQHPCYDLSDTIHKRKAKRIF